MSEGTEAEDCGELCAALEDWWVPVISAVSVNLPCPALSPLIVGLLDRQLYLFHFGFLSSSFWILVHITRGCHVNYMCQTQSTSQLPSYLCFSWFQGLETILVCCRPINNSLKNKIKFLKKEFIFIYICIWSLIRNLL